MRILVVGGGLFGCNVAIELAKANFEVSLAEKSEGLMLHASKHNHNRLHLGYHYLRSIHTAKQSIDGLLSFLFYYGDSVLHSFPNYYAIAKEGSFTDSDGFVQFCDEVGIDYDEEYPSAHFLNRDMVESCFKVPEPIFDFQVLQSMVEKRVASEKINLKLNTTCQSLTFEQNLYKATLNGEVEEYDVVINATYAGINELNLKLGAEAKRVKYQDVVIPNFNYQSPPIGLTIMDGPFCSIMPKGKEQNKFLLYHVSDSVLKSEIRIDNPKFDLESFDHLGIYKSSQDYYPFLKDVEHEGYYRTIRAVHENKDDARVTELHTYHDFPNYFSILSGKVTTCVQVSLNIKHILQKKNRLKHKIL